MLSIHHIFDTIDMIDKRHLDIRTITMGISLLDCVSEDPKRCCEKIYDKICRRAQHLVRTGEEIQGEFGIPIVNKRISVTPMALVAGGCDTEDYVPFAHAMDRAAKTCGVDFIGGYSALVQKGFAHGDELLLRRLPQDYTLTAEQLLNRLQATLRDFTAEEFAALDAAGQMDWRFVEGQKRYIYRAAETLVATHPDLAARQLDPPVPERSWDRFEPQHDQMVRTGAVSADITLRTSIGMTDETFARALAAAKAEGRDTVHVKVWLPLPAACPAQSNITLDSFTVQPTYIAPETAPQRTAYWEADLAENCRFGAQYSYRSTAHYAAPLEMQADPVQPDFDTAEQLPHIAFTPYMKALAAQLTEGITDPVQKAKRIYDFVTLNVHYHFQPCLLYTSDAADEL